MAGHEGYPEPYDQENTEQRNLYECPREDCGSELVYPLEWWQTPQYDWTIICHCPDCDRVDVDTYSQAEVNSFDQFLNHARWAIEKAIEELELERMETEAARFVDALRSDHILPEDF